MCLKCSMYSIYFSCFYYYPFLRVIVRLSWDVRYNVVQIYRVSSRVSLTCLLHSVLLLWKEASVSAHDICPLWAMHSRKNGRWLRVDGWPTNELLRLAQTPNYCMPRKKLGLLEQPLMSVGESDTSAKFGLAVNRDSSGDLTQACFLSSLAWHFAVARPLFNGTAPVSKRLSEVFQFYLHSHPCFTSPHLAASKKFYQHPLSSRWD